MNNFNGKSIVLFDGVCNLCNASVNFLIKHDKKALFQFASLQSDAAKEILLQFPLKKIDSNTIVLIADKISYVKSTAVLRILGKLGGFYILFYSMLIIPQFIRDKLYNYVAKNRYKWYGKRKTCRVPSSTSKSRFLD